MYFVTYRPSAQVEQVVHAINTVTTTDSSVIISDLKQTTEYTITVDVGTAGSEHRSLRGSGEFKCYCPYTFCTICILQV